MIQARPIFDRLTALADPTRSRLLLLLDRHELTVGELCVALQLPQSTVSRHLKTLADEGLGRRRAPKGRAGATRCRQSALDPSARDASGSSCATRSAPRRRRDRIWCAPNGCSRSAARRRRRSSRRRAGQWDRVRAELYGARTDLVAARRAARSDVGRSETSAAAPGRRRRRSRHSSRASWPSTNRARCSPPRASALGIARQRRAAQRTTRGSAHR